MRLSWLLLALVAAAATVRAEIYSWVDADGVVHLTDDREAIPEDAPSGEGRAALHDVWESAVDPLALSRRQAGGRAAGSTSLEEDRTLRVLRGAAADLERGENARAVAALQSVLREDPTRAEAHWYLALVDRDRGRYESAAGHLQAFLAHAGDDLQPLRETAERRLRDLEDERRLADPQRKRGPTRFESVPHEHFRVRHDAELSAASPAYATTVIGFLEEARDRVGGRLGAYPAEPMGVVLYGKAAYVRAHRHRFSFQTVGFFDGRIHVVSAAHPADELRALLHHEYTHAIFREQTGGDRPFWLNEGLSEISERSTRGLERLTRSERVALKLRIDAGDWLPLRRLAPSFSGLDDGDARAAYLEALAAAHWIEAQTDQAGRRRLLQLLGAGSPDDEALQEVLGLDTDGVDAAVRSDILSDFPASNPDPAGAASWKAGDRPR